MLCVLVLTLMAAGLAQTAAATDTFSWPAELVALDETARIATARTQVVGDAQAALKNLKSGDRVILNWSGVTDYGVNVSRVSRADAKPAEERFMLPVEFVSYDDERRYVTFKTGVPAEALGALKGLKIGDWFVATSNHRPANDKTPVIRLRPWSASAP